MDDDDDDNQQMLPPAQPTIRYEHTFTAAAPRIATLRGDKILLPASALEMLLNAAAAARHASGAAQRSAYGGGGGAFDDFRSFGYRNGSSGGGGGGEFELPQPLTFQLSVASTGPASTPVKSVYAGIREFSAAEGEVVLSDYLWAALGLGGEGDAGDAKPPQQVTVAFHPLPKGTFVHLRPLAAGYNPADWRPLLERQLREGYTTLTRGAVFTVRGNSSGGDGGDGGNASDAFRFRVDGFRPEGDGICVVDTDLEVDIEALDEEQARETMRKIQQGGDDSSGSSSSTTAATTTTSVGGAIDIWKPVSGQVCPGDYVDYELPSWDRSRPLAIVLTDGNGDDDDDGVDKGYTVDLLVSPFSTRQRARPRETEHVWANFDVADAADGSKTIVLQPSNSELETAEALRIAVHGWKPPAALEGTSIASRSEPHRFTLRARTVLEEEGGSVLGGSRATASSSAQEDHSPDDEQCQNCFQWVPRRTMVLHENFCLRNNVACPQCKQVFQKRSAAWAGHWHCALDPEDGGRGSTAASKAKHDRLCHPGFVSADLLYRCPADTCQSSGVVGPFTSLAALARHRTTSCPAKLILCQFCQLEVPQEGDPADPAVDAATVLTGMTPHERADGARTTDCYLCGAIVRMRDMRAHLQHHDLDRQHRVPPAVCRDALCGRTLYGVGARGEIKGAPADDNTSSSGGNPLGLCRTCFAPLYVSTHDPEGKALRRRVERRYLTQLLTGCGKAWCANTCCKTGRLNQGLPPFAGEGAGRSSVAVLLPLIKPLVAEAVAEPAKPVHFCVDEESQKRRAVAERLAGQDGGGVYELEWCVAACEAEGADASKAWEWLTNWAPQRRP